MRTFLLMMMTAALMLSWNGASAQRTYKWVDSQGNVSYHDRPPPAESGYRVEERDFLKTNPSQAGNQPGATVNGPPVVLYSIPKCPVCDLVRTHLQRRKVPFSEKNAERDIKIQEELRSKVGALTVPAITVGDRVLKDYSEGWLDSELDSAGYPKVESSKPAAEDTGFRAPTQ